MRILYFFILLLLPLNVFSQNGWYWTNQAPITNNLIDVHFVSDLTGYSVGQHGVVLKTIDGGYTWTQKGALGGEWLQSIYFTSPNTGYVCGFNNGIYKTTNGGNNWINIHSSGNTAYLDLHFINENTGFVGGFYSECILKTTNAGANWFYVGPNTGFKFMSIHFLNETTGFAGTTGDFGNPPYTGGQIFKTTNGGNNWQLSLNRHLLANISDIKQVNQNIIAVSSIGRIYSTTNLGVSWDSTQLTGNYFYNFSSKSSIALIASDNGNIFRSSNSGMNWTIVNDGTNLINRSVAFTNNIAVTVGHNGKISRSTDTGLTWVNNQNIPTNHLNKVAFLDENTGLAVGQSGTILYTSTAGNIWTRKDSIPNYNINEISITDSGKIYLGADSGKILYSTDFGNNWQISTISFDHVHVLNFFTENNGIAITEGGHLLKTYNAGLNWTNVSHVPIFFEVLDGYFFDSANFLVSSYGGDIFKTSNGGINFSNPFSTFMLEDSLTCLEFINNNTGFCSGSNGRILKTTNAGENWIELNSGIPVTLNSIRFTSEDTGYVSGASGKIYKTYDGGQNWVDMISNTSNPLKDICFTSTEVGYIVGLNGVILKTVTAGELIGITPISSTIPKGYSISNIYPNPFNPSTNITFNIPRQSNVEIKIFDLTGRQISSLVNERLIAGEYKLTWNAVGLPSGIYFCTLQSENHIESRKMVLLK